MVNIFTFTSIVMLAQAGFLSCQNVADDDITEAKMRDCTVGNFADDGCPYYKAIIDCLQDVQQNNDVDQSRVEQVINHFNREWDFEKNLCPDALPGMCHGNHLQNCANGVYSAAQVTRNRSEGSDINGLCQNVIDEYRNAMECLDRMKRDFCHSEDGIESLEDFANTMKDYVSETTDCEIE